MATRIQGSSRPAEPGLIIDPATVGSAATAPNLFTNMQPEPLVVSSPAWTAPRQKSAGAAYRIFDLSLSAVFLTLLAPVMIIAALLIKLGGRGPIIFRHSRIGKDGEPFVCLKFRTMENRAEDMLPDLLGACDTIRWEWQRDHKIRQDPRVTAVGRVLRRFSVDELPQLFNVLRGEMSIVGPRPIVEAEVERYGQNFSTYCSVKPGLTGLWQISGRNRVSYDRRVELDCEYARGKSLAADTWIILRTLPVVVQGDGF